MKPNGVEHESYFNEGDLEIEEALRGEPSSRRIRITWVHRTDIYLPDGKVLPYEGDNQFESGLRGIWMFADTSDVVWGCQRPSFVPMEGLARVKAILSGSTRNIYR